MEIIYRLNLFQMQLAEAKSAFWPTYLELKYILYAFAMKLQFSTFQIY